MKRDGLRFGSRIDVSNAVPNILSFSEFFWPQTFIQELLVNLGETWAVIPQKRKGLTESLEKRKRVYLLFFIRTIKTNNNVVEVIDLADLIDDVLQGRALKLGKQTR